MIEALKAIKRTPEFLKTEVSHDYDYPKEDVVQHVLSILKEKVVLPRNEIVLQSRYGDLYTGRALNLLIDRGLVIKTKEGKSNRFTTYRFKGER